MKSLKESILDIDNTTDQVDRDATLVALSKKKRYPGGVDMLGNKLSVGDWVIISFNNSINTTTAHIHYGYITQIKGTKTYVRIAYEYGVKNEIFHSGMLVKIDDPAKFL